MASAAINDVSTLRAANETASFIFSTSFVKTASFSDVVTGAINDTSSVAVPVKILTIIDTAYIPDYIVRTTHFSLLANCYALFRRQHSVFADALVEQNPSNSDAKKQVRGAIRMSCGFRNS
eukprot:GHVT01067076.1.p2 GENE.GHVT01067076.1~~GHVT01067076.1.p2  ORF type:complete len:121 (-),score=10.14 GHVT01067076.1:1255-1617(-)